MITEDFVSFEVAKLLKEKGFDELCIFKYNSEGVRMKAGVAIDEWQNSELDDDECSCVSHQMAMKWLRELHNIHINVCYDSTYSRHYKFHCCLGTKEKSDARRYDTYEQAAEAGIKYSLENLI